MDQLAIHIQIVKQHSIIILMKCTIFMLESVDLVIAY